LIDTEPYIALNAGLGSLREAVEQVEYCNSSPTTRWGAERARNGQRRPYGVKLWGIGNEMYGDWQLGQIAVQRYALRHNAFAAALRAVDPSLRLVGVGAPGEWDRVALDACGSQSDMWSAHFYCLGDAITVARGLHVLLRRADVVTMANWAQTVNVIGAIKTNGISACMDAAGWVLALYRRHFERHLLRLPPAPAGLDWVAARS